MKDQIYEEMEAHWPVNYIEVKKIDRATSAVRRALGKLVLMGLSTILSVVFAECAVRLVAPQKLSIWAHTDDGLVVLRANLRGHITPHGRLFETNSMGMRDREHAQEKNEGTYRILLLGDSFMEAAQVEWEDSLPALLERALNEGSNRSVEVINAGVSGWGTDDYAAYLLRYGKPLSPDLVLISMTLHNDVSDNLAMLHHSFEIGGELVEKPVGAPPLHVKLRRRLQDWTAGNSHLYQLVAGSLRADQVRAEGRRLDRYVAELLGRDESKRLRTGWAMTFRLLEKIVRESRAIGAETAIFLIPLAVQVTESRLSGFTETLEIKPSSLDLTRPQSRMLDWSACHGIDVIDLLPRLREWARQHETDPYLQVDGHWTRDGHELAAAVVARELRRSQPKLAPTSTE